MAEKGIVVADAVSGESIATRDASVQDEDSNDRVIQLMDKARRKPLFRRADTVSRAIAFGSDDPLGAMHYISAGMNTNALLIGEATHVIVRCTFYCSDEVPYPVVTPFIIDPDIADPTTVNAVLGLLEPKAFTGLNLDVSSASYTFHDDQSSQKWVFTSPQIWDVLGAEKIAFHCYDHGQSINSMRFWWKAITADKESPTGLGQPSNMIEDAAWMGFDA